MRSSAHAALFLLFVTFPTLLASATTWNVGPSRTYKMPSDVVSLVQDHDTVLIDEGTYRDRECVWKADGLMIVGIGRVELLPDITQAGESIWTAAGGGTQLIHLAFRQGTERSGAGIGLYAKGAGCQVDSCMFSGNSIGLRIADGESSYVQVNSCTFENNEFADLDVGRIVILNLRTSWFRGSANAVNVRSRALMNEIKYNFFTDKLGASTTTLELMRGGWTFITGNILHGARTIDSSKHFISYVANETASAAFPHAVECAWNTFVNDLDSMTFIETAGSQPYEVRIVNNIVAGKGTLIGDTTIPGRVIIDTAGNHIDQRLDSVGFVNTADHDYHLLAWSPARDTYTSPIVQLPFVEYLHPLRIQNRPGNNATVGAFDYEEPPPTPRTWLVGWGRSSGTPSDVCRRVHDGDTVLIDSGEYVDGISDWSANNLTIIGLGKVVIRSNGSTSFKNALWEIEAGSVFIEGIEFRDHTTIDGKGTGLFIVGGDVTLRSCTFTGLQRCIVFDPQLIAARLTIEQCAFEGLGSETAYPLIDCRAIKSLSISGSSFHNAGSSAIVSSHAHSNVISACRADVTDLSLQPALDFPSGGFVQLSGTNVRADGGGAEREILRYGSGTMSDARDNRLFVGYNTIVNDGNATVFVRAETTRLKSMRVINNLLVGDGLQSSGQASNETNTASNHYAYNISLPGFVDAAAMDYRITDTSPARFAAVQSGSITIVKDDGIDSTYSFQPLTSYVHPQNTARRTSWYDVGAYESVLSSHVDVVIADHPAIRIAPNPAQTSLTLTLPSALVGHDVVILDMQGSEVARITARDSSLRISLDGWSAGIFVSRCGTLSTRFFVLP